MISFMQFNCRIPYFIDISIIIKLQYPINKISICIICNNNICIKPISPIVYHFIINGIIMYTNATNFTQQLIIIWKTYKVPLSVYTKLNTLPCFNILIPTGIFNNTFAFNTSFNFSIPNACNFPLIIKS